MKLLATASLASIAASSLLLATAPCAAEESIADAISGTEREPAELTEAPGRQWFHVSAMADIESAYICRGYIWDARPYSAQEVSGMADFEDFGRFSATAWSMSSLSHSGNSSSQSRYAYAEVDYVLKYSVDVPITDGWRIQNTIIRQWVTNPGYRDSHTSADWQVMQLLHNPFVTPYWRLRYIHHPRQSAYWCVGARRTFEILEGLDFTIDFFGDLGDHRHYRVLYGPRDDGSRYHAGLQALNLVFRLDYRLMDHVSVFAFLGEFCVVHREARDALKASSAKEAKRDLTYGGLGVAIDF